MNNEQEDMSVSPLHNDTRFKPGVSGNPNGRPKGSGNKRPRSKMRNQLELISQLNPDAIEILRHMMTGKDKDGNPIPPPPKDKVDMAKFIVKAIESLNSSCLREEMAILGVQKTDADGARALEENQQETEKATDNGLFSMDMPPTETKH